MSDIINIEALIRKYFPEGYEQEDSVKELGRLNGEVETQTTRAYTAEQELIKAKALAGYEQNKKLRQKLEDTRAKIEAMNPVVKAAVGVEHHKKRIQETDWDSLAEHEALVDALGLAEAIQGDAVREYQEVSDE